MNAFSGRNETHLVLLEHATNLLARCMIPANSPYVASISSQEATNKNVPGRNNLAARQRSFTMRSISRRVRGVVLIRCILSSVGNNAAYAPSISVTARYASKFFRLVMQPDKLFLAAFLDHAQAAGFPAEPVTARGAGQRARLCGCLVMHPRAPPRQDRTFSYPTPSRR